MTEREEWMEILRKADAAGNIEDAKYAAKKLDEIDAAEKDQEPTVPAVKPAPKTSLKEDLKPLAGLPLALPEAALNLGSSLIAKPVSDVMGLSAKFLGPKGGDPEAYKNYIQNALTYEPRTEAGKVAAEYNPLTLIGKAIGAGTESLASRIPEDTELGFRGRRGVEETLNQLVSLAGTKYTPSQIAAGVQKIPGVNLPGKALGAIIDTGSNLIRPHLPGGVDKNAGRMLRKVAGDRTDAVITALENAKPGTYAGQAAVPAGSNEFAGVQALARKENSSPYSEMDAAQEAARLADLERVTPNKFRAEQTRDVITQPNYGAADKAVVTLDQSFMDILDDLPKGTLEKAAEIARMEGRPFIMGKYTPARTVYDPHTNMNKTVPAQYPTITGESLHYIKRAIDTVMRDPATGIVGDLQTAAGVARGKFLNKFEGIVPNYKTARTGYAKYSEPVNQADVLGAATNVLRGFGGAERAGPFFNVLGRGEQALLKKATGQPRFETLSQVLTPEQLGVMKDVAAQLERDRLLAQQTSEGLPKARELTSDFGKPVQPVGLLERSVVIANAILNRLEGHGRAKTVSRISEILQDPALTAKIMRAANPAERGILQKALNNRAVLLAGGQLGGLNQVPEDLQ